MKCRYSLSWDFLQYGIVLTMVSLQCAFSFSLYMFSFKMKNWRKPSSYMLLKYLNCTVNLKYQNIYIYITGVNHGKIGSDPVIRSDPVSTLTRFFQRGITPEREITWTRKKMCISYFSMRNPCMKFQNSSMHSSWQTDGCTHDPKPICPVNFFEVGGITNRCVNCNMVGKNGSVGFILFFQHKQLKCTFWLLLC